MRDDSLDINYAYSILDLKPGATLADVKQAYRQLVKTWHPDRFAHPQEKQEAEEKIKQINAAYNQLKSYQPSLAIPSFHTRPTKISSDRSNAETFYDWGVENAKLERYDEAIACFTQAIRLNPYCIEAYKYRGFICSQLGYEHRTTSDLNKAAQLERDLGNKQTNSGSPWSRRESKPKSLIARFFQWVKRLLRWKKQFK